MIAELAPGQRTPMFCIAAGHRTSATPGTCGSRCCKGGHSWTGVVRCETSGQLARGRGRGDRRPHGGRAPARRERAARRPAGAAEPRADRRARARAAPPHGRPGPRLPGAAHAVVSKDPAGGIVTSSANRSGASSAPSTRPRARSAWCSTTTTSCSSTTSWSCAPRCRRRARCARTASSPRPRPSTRARRTRATRIASPSSASCRPPRCAPPRCR